MLTIFEVCLNSFYYGYRVDCNFQAVVNYKLSPLLTRNRGWETRRFADFPIFVLSFIVIATYCICYALGLYFENFYLNLVSMVNFKLIMWLNYN